MEVTYQVRLNPARHELDIVIEIADPPPGALTLATPTWVPGDYDFATYGRDVFDVKALDRETGAPLPVRRRGWSSYKVEADGRALRVRYRASAASVDFSEGCGVLGDLNGVLLGTRYLRVVEHNGGCAVRYQIPEGWAVHHPSGATPLGDNTWAYDGYERLLDTPVAFGQFDLISRDVRGTTFHHLFLNRAVGFEGGVEAFVDDLVKVSEAFHDIYGSFPFADYTFVMSFNPNDSWGLEHLSSTMVGLDPSTFYDEDQYKVSVRVCAHELFHAWNVRRLRPAPLMRLDFEAGDFTEGLWVAEGFTRYYEFLSCTRTGIYTPEQFLSAVTGYYTHLTAIPAYRRVSPADSSAASYLNHDKYPGRANSAIDYYDAGMVIAFELDAILRTETHGRQSLDTVFAAFYEAYVGKGAGYTVDDLRLLRPASAGPGRAAAGQGAGAGAAGPACSAARPGLYGHRRARATAGRHPGQRYRPQRLQRAGRQSGGGERPRGRGQPGQCQRLPVLAGGPAMGDGARRRGAAGCCARQPVPDLRRRAGDATHGHEPGLGRLARTGGNPCGLAEGTVRADNGADVLAGLLREFPRDRDGDLAEGATSP